MEQVQAVGASSESEAARAAVREKVWERLRGVALPDTRFVYDLTWFIPDFAGSEKLYGRLQELPCYAGDGPVFVTPDNCLPDMKRALINAGRPLLQTIAVSMGFHYFPPGSVLESEARFAGTLDGAQLLAEQVDLTFVRNLGRLDFVVTGACAVDPRTGVRFGKGHGFFDLEWAILSELGVVDGNTPVVICVHDCQVVETGLTPSSHDTAGDWILTPTRTIRVAERHPNPSGIRWELVDEARLAEIEPLRQLSSERALDESSTTASAKDPAVTLSISTTSDSQRFVREKVWTSLRSVARPDSRFHWDFGSFIADFEGSEICSEHLREFESWTGSNLVFITPDNSTEAVRRAAISDGKAFLMTTYGIRRGFLALDPGDVPASERAYAATLDGMDYYGRPVDLDEIAKLGHIGLLVTGGSAVSYSGLRIGKGHGYFDLEWALLSEVGSTDESTEIVDIVHDCQVVDLELAASEHDVRVDWIVTPTRTIRVEGPPRPAGRVRWELIGGTEFELIPPVIDLAVRKGLSVTGQPIMEESTDNGGVR
ncbi:MAG: 5-formyltetrahydrofolate cyclo-ligase [Acidimicrobiales bacterium]|jgi:5-formyltetrahydrofolate cyclo-ligase